MSILALLPSLISVGKRLATLVPGETDDRVIAAAEAFTQVLKAVQPMVTGPDATELEETLENLIARVETKAERVMDKLGDAPGDSVG